MIMSTGYVLVYHEGPSWELVATSTGLLFALPGIRSSQPGLPQTPTISDSEFCIAALEDNDNSFCTQWLVIIGL
jgi:hypothetical protein